VMAENKIQELEKEITTLKFALATVGVRQNKIAEHVNKNTELISNLFKHFQGVLSEFVKWGDRVQKRVKSFKKERGE